MPSEVEDDNLDVNEIEGAIPRAWWVLVDLWTVEEGRSDLTLEIRLTDTGGELYDIEINNLHVLKAWAGDTQTKSLRFGAHALIREMIRRRDVSQNALAQQGIKKTRTKGLGKLQIIVCQRCP